MGAALAAVLGKTNVQVLWKFRKYGEYSDDILEILTPYINNGRLRMTDWLTVDVYSLLETGNIAVSIHHGGSNCFHEAVA